MTTYKWLKERYERYNGGNKEHEREVKPAITDGYAYLDILKWGVDGIEDYLLAQDSIAELLQIEDELQRSKEFSAEEKARLSGAVTSRLVELGVY